MRNVLFALLICLTTIATASAQETLSFGPVVGVNFAKISNSSEADTEFNTGFAAGAQLTYSNENNWGLGGGIMYSREGADATANNIETSTNLTYIRVPLKGYLFFRENEDRFRPKIFIGPSIGFLLDADREVGDDKFETFDLGLTAGAGFNARLSESGTWFNFDAGYTHGLLDVAKEGDGANRTITLTAGVLFGF